MTDQELDDLEAWLRERPIMSDCRDAADAIAELRVKNAGLVGALADLVRDSLASDFNEYWSSYKAASKALRDKENTQ